MCVREGGSGSEPKQGKMVPTVVSGVRALASEEGIPVKARGGLGGKSEKGERMRSRHRVSDSMGKE